MVRWELGTGVREVPGKGFIFRKISFHNDLSSM